MMKNDMNSSSSSLLQSSTDLYPCGYISLYTCTDVLGNVLAIRLCDGI